MIMVMWSRPQAITLTPMSTRTTMLLIQGKMTQATNAGTVPLVMLSGLPRPLLTSKTLVSLRPTW